MRELRPGLWHWEAPHPEWEPGEPWDRVVSSYAIDDGERLLLFDPLAVPSEIEERATDRDPVVVLTAAWLSATREAWWSGSARRCSCLRPTVKGTSCGSTVSLPSRLPGAARTWSGCLPKTRLTGTCFRPAIGCPVEVEAFPGREHNDLVLWIERHRAVIAGDTLVDFGRGLEIPAEWLRQGVTREQITDGVRPLLELPVDVVLATHGGPTDWTALERALS